MKTLYIECNMGAAGDMLMAALLELLTEAERGAFLARMNGLLPNVRVAAEPSVKRGVTGTHVSVVINGEAEETSVDADMAEDRHDHGHHHDHEDHHDHDHHHDHRHASPRHIEETLAALPVPENVKRDAAAVYHLIAEAESAAHGVPVAEIHFHEVGELDAVADVTGVCLLMAMIAADRVVVSPVHVGGGFVRCAHGVLPVPAPATAHILRDVPCYGGSIRGELCTPTGAALLKHFAQDFGAMPLMRTQKIGYGMGKKDFEAANCVRAFLGVSHGEGDAVGAPNGEIAELSCNLDDMTGEAVGFACEELLAAGARDVFTTPIAMKKSRPAILLTVLCDPARADEFAALILKHTTTFGVRKAVKARYELNRRFEERDGLRVKIGEGYGTVKSKTEYEDWAAAARQKNTH